MSGQFDAGPKERAIRETAIELEAMGEMVLIADAHRGARSGKMTDDNLFWMTHMVAFAYGDYGQKTASKYDTYYELRFAHDHSIPIISVKMYRGDWPPCPACSNGRRDEFGCSQNKAVFGLDLPHIDMSPDFDAGQCARYIIEELEPKKKMSIQSESSEAMSSGRAPASMGDVADAFSPLPSLRAERMDSSPLELGCACSPAPRLYSALAACPVSSGKREEATSLTFKPNSTQEEIAEKIRKAFDKNEPMTKLELAGAGLGPVGAQALARALELNRTLTELRVQKTKISSGNAEVIAKALEKNQALTMLDLSGNEIGPPGAEAISRALMKNKALTSLMLNGNSIGDHGCKTLAKALEKSQVLTELRLGENKIGRVGGEALARALGVNRGLKQLELTKNLIKKEGVEAIAKALKGNQVLMRLTWTRQEIGPGGVKALEEAQASRSQSGHPLLLDL